MKIKVITFGCSNNLAESEIISGLLVKEGHSIVEQKEELKIVNVCSVKGPSLNKGIKVIKKSIVPVIVTGCIPISEIQRIKNLRKDIVLVNTHNFDKVMKTVKNIKKGIFEDCISYEKKMRVCFPKVRKNEIVNIVPISSGCKGNCTYCSVKLIKGNLFSFPPEKIIKEVKKSIKEGCKEIWITGQDTGCYGLDIGYNLPKLLKQILDLDGEFKVRLGMANPNFIYKYLKELIKIFNHQKMFKFLHIPVQSGSDRILWLMKRAYNSQQYIKLVQKLKKGHPDLSISTDIIVGFPTETEEDFEKSIELIKKTKPDVLNLSKFWIRSNTEAANLIQVKGNIKKERISRIKNIFDKIALNNNLQWVGWQGEIIIDEMGKNESSIGRNYAYKPIIVKGKYDLGKKLKVEIKKATKFDLRAKIL